MYLEININSPCTKVWLFGKWELHALEVCKKQITCLSIDEELQQFIFNLINTRITIEYQSSIMPIQHVIGGINNKRVIP